MGFLALDRRIDAEVLDTRGILAVTTGGTRLQGIIREVPNLFVEGAQLAIHLEVDGDRFEAVCRVLDDAVMFTPGSHIQLEVLRALPTLGPGSNAIEAFDLVPRTPVHAPPPNMASIPPQEAFADEIDREDDEPTGVVGTLREMPVSEIVQTLAQGGRDALVEVKPKGRPNGVIGVERGRVVYARTESQTGELAFFELFSASRGAFRIRYGRHADERNIACDTTFLLLEGARILDEHMSGKLFPSAPPAPALAAPETDLPPTLSLGRESTILTIDELGATLIDNSPLQARGPASQPSGPFTRFFDEAGVTTPPPLPQETQRFTSLQVSGLADLDDTDHVDSDRTTRERRSFPPSEV